MCVHFTYTHVGVCVCVSIYFAIVVRQYSTGLVAAIDKADVLNFMWTIELTTLHTNVRTNTHMYVFISIADAQSVPYKKFESKLILAAYAYWLRYIHTGIYNIKIYSLFVCVCIVFVCAPIQHSNKVSPKSCANKRSTEFIYAGRQNAQTHTSKLINCVI